MIAPAIAEHAMLFPRKGSKSGRYTPEEVAALVERIIVLLEDLWRPARFLSDLNAVWPDLTDEQRAEIEESTVYKEKFHENRANEIVRELQSLVGELPSGYRDIRGDIGRFLRQWRQEEPDTLKILVGRLKTTKPRSISTPATPSEWTQTPTDKD